MPPRHWVGLYSAPGTLFTLAKHVSLMYMHCAPALPGSVQSAHLLIPLHMA